MRGRVKGRPKKEIFRGLKAWEKSRILDAAGEEGMPSQILDCIECLLLPARGTRKRLGHFSGSSLREVAVIKRKIKAMTNDEIAKLLEAMARIIRVRGEYRRLKAILLAFMICEKLKDLGEEIEGRPPTKAQLTKYLILHGHFPAGKENRDFRKNQLKNDLHYLDLKTYRTGTKTVPVGVNSCESFIPIHSRSTVFNRGRDEKGKRKFEGDKARSGNRGGRTTPGKVSAAKGGHSGSVFRRNANVLERARPSEHPK
jgi:hypothetical protein